MRARAVVCRPLPLHPFFFNDTPTTEICTLSLHDALPISGHDNRAAVMQLAQVFDARVVDVAPASLVVEICASESKVDRKSTRLNSSHMSISYAVFCLKKKNGDARREKG